MGRHASRRMGFVRKCQKRLESGVVGDGRFVESCGEVRYECEELKDV